MPNFTSSSIHSSVSAAAEALQLAEEALDGALFAGIDTSTARADLSAAREALAAAQSVDAQEAAAAAAAERRVADEAAAAAVTEAEESFAAAVEVIESAPDVEPLPEPELPRLVRLTAQDLARARAALTAAQVTHRTAIEKRNAVRARIDSKQRELDAISSRRIAGDEQPGDPVAMTALSIDVEGLAKMLAPLAAAAEAVAPIVQQQAVRTAETALAKAKVSAEIDGMADRVRALEQHFVAQVRALRLAAADRGMHNLGSIYVSSDSLRKVAHGAWL